MDGLILGDLGFRKLGGDYGTLEVIIGSLYFDFWLSLINECVLSILFITKTCVCVFTLLGNSSMCSYGWLEITANTISRQYY